MAIPVIPHLPDPPILGTDIEEDFSNKTDALYTAYNPWIDALNAALAATIEGAADANYSAISTTSREIGAGILTFEVPTGKAYMAGTDIKIVSGSNPADLYMYATVNSYDTNSGWLNVTVTSLLGAGQVKNDWIISLSGEPAVAGVGQLTNPVVTGTITEQVHAIVDSASVTINPEDGSIQTWTLGANRTPDITMVSGQAITLMIADGSAYAVNWSTINPTWVGGSAPTLPTTGYAVIVLWKVATTIYAVYTGNVA